MNLKSVIPRRRTGLVLSAFVVGTVLVLRTFSADAATPGARRPNVIVFLSDHGCHFRTRNGEYKRACHDAPSDPSLSAVAQKYLLDYAPEFLDGTGNRNMKSRFSRSPGCRRIVPDSVMTL